MYVNFHAIQDGKLLLNPYTVNDWLVISQVTMSDKGIYTCFANSSIGSAESTVASLTIGLAMHSFRLGPYLFMHDYCTL